MATWFSRLFAKAKPDDPLRLPVFYPYAYVPTDLKLTPDEALSLSAVWACVTVIACDLAASPWEVHSRDGRGRRVALPDDNLSYLLNTRPNQDTTAQALRESLLIQALTFGDGYLEIVEDVAGRVVELQLLGSERVRSFRVGDGIVPIVWAADQGLEPGSLVYRFQQQDGTMVFLRSDQVFHLRGPSANSLLGEGIVMRAAKAAALAHAAEQFALGYYARGTTPTGVLKFDGQYSKNDEDRARLRADWEQNQQGARNSHKPLILPKGWDWQSISNNAAESQVLQSRQHSVEDIARFFRVPGHLVGIVASSQGYGRNLEELNLSYVRNTLTPWVKRLEQEADFKLIPARAPRYTSINTGWLTLGTAKDRATADEIRLRSGVESVNEIREREGLEDIGPAGDLHLVPTTLTLLEEENLTKSPEPPSEGPGAPADESGAGGQGEDPSADDNSSAGLGEGDAP